MKTLNASLILQKNQLYTDQPWITLFEIDLDSATTWRFAAYPENVTWNGYEWQAFPAIIEPINEESSGRLSGLNVHVANVDRTVSAYLENENLLGNTVTLYFVYRGDLSITSDILSFEYRINRVETSDESAVFQLGHEDLFAITLPWQRYIRDRCRHVFRDSKCGYPNDEFDDTSRQDIKAGGDGSKGGGWTSANMDNASICDIDITTSGELTIKGASGGPWKFWGSTQTAPLIYKTFSGDFDCYCHYTSVPGEEGGAAFFIQSVDDYGDWIAWVAVEINGTDYLYSRNTVNGSSDQVFEAELLPYWRIVRSGSTLQLWAHDDTTTTWTKYREEVRIDFSHTVRIGFAAFTSSSSEGTNQTWKYFRMTNGGLATCDYSLDGPNGCRAHQNTLRFGGAPSIPYGRFYGA